MNLVGPVVRGEMLARIENSLNAEDIQESIGFMKAHTLFEVAKDDRGALVPGEENHAKNDVFNTDGDGTGWWGDTAIPETGAERDKIFRLAYIKALELRQASQPLKRIRQLWIRGVSHVEAYVVELDADILVLWLTPEVPAQPGVPVPPPGLPLRNDRMWAVGRQTYIDDTYVKAFEDHGYSGELSGRTFEIPELPDVKAFNIPGY